ncbi:hypothetical protein GGR51DRAFT_557168 [Nemania sp. FL0031]|nr:hypothetical protein GGR51DRAFT_557168 [Nemania sp. FL0031]
MTSRTLSNNNQPSLGFQTEPGPEINLSTQYQYPVEFRHLNCAEYGKTPAAKCQKIRHGLATFPDYGVSVATTCVGANRMEIRGQRPQQQPQFIHLCPGACNRDGVDLGATASLDASTVERLRDAAQAFYLSVHPGSTRPVEIVGLRVSWLPGIPAYTPPGESTLRPHSSAVTGGHLGLLQTRGQGDTIQVDFLSCDSTAEYIIRQSWQRILLDLESVFHSLVSKLPGKRTREVLRTVSAGPYGKYLILAVSGSLVVLLSSHIPLGG